MKLSTPFAAPCLTRVAFGLLLAMLSSCGDSISAPSQADALLEESTARAMRRCHDERLAEAGAGLAAIVTAEQVAFQRNGGAAYVAASGAAQIWTELGVDLEGLDDRWLFEIGGVSSHGFVASATGRPRTPIRGVRIVLAYERNQEPVWTIEGCRQKRGRSPL